MTDTLAEDWIALWQSEMAAMAADRELRESWTALLALWAGAANATLQFLPRQNADAAGPPNGAAGAAQPPRTAPAAAAPDPGGDETRWLYERIAQLESRLAAFEREHGKRPPRRTPRPRKP